MTIRKLVKNPGSIGINIAELINLHYGQNSLLVRHGDYIYNVTKYPQIYYHFAI